VCWTVGAQVTSAGFDDSLVEKLAAGSWSVGTTAVPQGQELNALTAVACATGPVCFAVGSHSTEAAADTLVESSARDAWSVMPSQSTGGGTDSFLNGVACGSATDCWAVGDAEPTTNGISTTNINTASTLIEQGNGSSWSIVSSPNPTGAQISSLLSVSCVSTTDCWAVGLSYPVANNGVTIGLNSTGPIAIAQTLTEHWNGQTWSVVSSPNVSPVLSDELISVTCVSTNDCWAVGAAEGMQTVQGLVEQWNGSSWTIVASPQTSGNESNGLFGVACAGASSCWAVGYSYLGSGASAKNFQTWVEKWNGSTWSTAASPNPGPDQVDALFAVTCTSVQDCNAVGAYGNGPIYDTLALQWDGSAWSVAGSENPTVSQGSFLYGVKCASSSLCVTAGSYNSSDGTLQTLIEQTSVPGPSVPEVPWPWLAISTAIPIVFVNASRRRRATLLTAGADRRSVTERSTTPSNFASNMW
jgi:hypothetical protein